MPRKSTHFQVIPQQSTQDQDTANLPLADRHATKTSGLFLLYGTGVDFSSRNNFASLCSFAKISAFVGSMIPWRILIGSESWGVIRLSKALWKL